MTQTPICYCFNYTSTDLERDILVNGYSTIVERLINDSRKGKCRCTENNLKGR